MRGRIFKKPLGKRGELFSLARKPGIVTGASEISEVEAMIQRYLELASSALKEDDPTSPDERKVSA